MNLRAFFKDAGKAASKKSPVILTTLAVTGTITTAYLAAKAAYKSVDVIRQAKEDKVSDFFGEVEDGPEPENVQKMTPPPFTPHDAFTATWKLYVPAAISAAITVVTIISVDRVGESRTAAFAAAYSVSDRMYREYQKKVTDKIGKNKEQAIRDELAEEGVRLDEERPDIIVRGRRGRRGEDLGPIIASPGPGKGQVYCKDSWSGRYFPNDIESLRKAVNDFNNKVINESFASLSDFWHLIGLDSTVESDNLGWNTDELLELGYTHTTYAGDPCIVIEYRTRPTSKFGDFH